MTVAVPIAIGVALATTLYAQFGWVWPNYETELKKEQSEQADKGSSKDEKSDGKKDKSGQEDKGSTKGKSGKPGKSTSAAASKKQANSELRREE